MARLINIILILLFIYLYFILILYIKILLTETNTDNYGHRNTKKCKAFGKQNIWPQFGSYL